MHVRSTRKRFSLGSRAKERPNTKQGADPEKCNPTQGRTAYDYNRFLVGFSLISIKYFYCITVLPSVLLHHVLTTDFLVIRCIFFITSFSAFKYSFSALSLISSSNSDSVRGRGLVFFFIE